MSENTLKAFTVGFALGALLSGYLGYRFGKRVGNAAQKPEFRIIMAAVILFIWSLAQILSLAFGTQVDAWLNGIMGAVAGFFFGDGFVETYRRGGNDDNK